MDSKRRDLMDRFLYEGSKELDLTPTQYQKAVSRYEAVGEYLDALGSPLKPYSPEIFAQGSMALGTTVKPIGRDEFDIDLMCQLEISSNEIPEHVKRIVGERLRSHEQYRKMLLEKNRCWRLEYRGEFHMDIIPGIPDTIRQSRSTTALLVPDKELQCWKESDPKGYTAWFMARATTRSHQSRSVQARVEPLPSTQNERPKFPLQVVVQLLKRHRDLMFMNRDDGEDAPISIVITTLAARAYDGSQSISSAMSNILLRMSNHITRMRDGTEVVENPVNHQENFADKWATHPHRRQCFYEWLNRAQVDFGRLEIENFADMREPLGLWLGDSLSTKIIRNYGQSIQKMRTTGAGIVVLPTTGELASKSQRSVTSPKHTFYGTKPKP